MPATRSACALSVAMLRASRHGASLPLAAARNGRSGWAQTERDLYRRIRSSSSCLSYPRRQWSRKARIGANHAPPVKRAARRHGARAATGARLRLRRTWAAAMASEQRWPFFLAGAWQRSPGIARLAAPHARVAACSVCLRGGCERFSWAFLAAAALTPLPQAASSARRWLRA
jgi:hypothetical protein